MSQKCRASPDRPEARWQTGKNEKLRLFKDTCKMSILFVSIILDRRDRLSHNPDKLHKIVRPKNLIDRLDFKAESLESSILMSESMNNEINYIDGGSTFFSAMVASASVVGVLLVQSSLKADASGANSCVKLA